MNGVYPGRGAKAYAPLCGPSQCVKRPCNTCTAPLQCAKRPCNTCAASSQCAKGSCTTCAASSQCAKRPRTTCTALSQCVKRSCNTCTVPSQCAKRPRTTCTASSQCVKRPRNTAQPFRNVRPYHGDNHSSLRDVWGAYAFAPLHVSGKLRCPRRGRPYPGTIIWPRVPGKLGRHP